jgi:hypothetical protein
MSLPAACYVAVSALFNLCTHTNRRRRLFETAASEIAINSLASRLSWQWVFLWRFILYEVSFFVCVFSEGTGNLLRL